MDEKLEELAKIAVQHITGKGLQSGRKWLEDAFNDYCRNAGFNEYDPDNIGFEMDDLVENLKKASWVAEIAGKPANSRTTEDIDRVVRNFICEYWLTKPEEVTTKDVADVLKVADPLSKRHLLAQRIAIECIHALDKEQLKQLDEVLNDIAMHPQINEQIRR